MIIVGVGGVVLVDVRKGGDGARLVGGEQPSGGGSCRDLETAKKAFAAS